MITTRKTSTAAKFVQAKFFNKRSPLAVSWAVNYICNYSCDYCQQWNKKMDLVSTEEAKAMIDKLHTLGLARINFTGGEPLLREEIGEWIDYAKSKNIRVALNSNGHLVPSMIGRLKNLDLLNMSLEGPECVHDAIRKKGSYKKIVEATVLAQGEGIKVKYTATLNKNNADHVGELVRTARKYNTVITFQPMEPKRLGSKMENPLMPERTQFVQAVEKLLQYKQTQTYRAHIGNSVNGLKYILSYPKVGHLECAFGRIAFRIEPDGRIAPCSLLRAKNFSIDLRRTDIADIKEEFKKIFLPSRKCSCGFCCQRIELNLIWNFKMLSLPEVARL